MPAFELRRTHFPAIAASVVAQGVAVTRDVGDVQRQVVPAATCNVEPFGITLATAANAGDAVSVADAGNVIKVVAMASLGAGQDIGVGSSNGALTLKSAGASGAVVWAIGKSQSGALAGETFSLEIRPRQLSGLAP